MMQSAAQDKGSQSHDSPQTVEHNSATEKHSKPKPKPAPNGGWQAWLQVLGSFIISCCTWGLVLSFGAFQSFYQLEFLKTYSASSISWIGTVQSFLLMFTGIFAGPVFDLGYHRELLYLGGFLTVFGMMMLSLGTSYYQIFLAQSVCVGLGSGVVYVPSLALVAASFTTKRTVAVALVSSGNSMGGIIFPVVFQQLILRVGFAWTTRIMGFTALAGFAIAIPLVLCRTVSLNENRRSLVDMSGWKDVQFLTLCIGGFFRFFGGFSPLIFLPVFAQTALHVSQTTSLNLLLIFNAASFVGRLLGPLIAYRTKIMLPWMVCCLAAAILCFVWVAIHSMAGFVTFAVIYGVVTGPMTSFPPGVVPLLCPSESVIGTRMGMLWGSTAFAFLFGTPIAAALSDTSSGHFLGLQLFSGATTLIGAILLLPLWAPIQRKHKRRPLRMILHNSS